jgi:hypothetical protein
VGRKLGTAMDHSAPRHVDKLLQRSGEDLAHGSSFNIPGVGGAPGMAENLVRESRPLFDAAGRCLEVSTAHASLNPARRTPSQNPPAPLNNETAVGITL